MKIKIASLLLGISFTLSMIGWAEESRSFPVTTITELITECGPNYCQVKIKSGNQTFIKHYDGSTTYPIASALINDIQRAKRITVVYETVGTQNRVSTMIIFVK